MYDIIERFCLGRRRLELFGKARAGCMSYVLKLMNVVENVETVRISRKRRLLAASRS